MVSLGQHDGAQWAYHGVGLIEMAHHVIGSAELEADREVTKTLSAHLGEGGEIPGGTGLLRALNALSLAKAHLPSPTAASG